MIARHAACRYYTDNTCKHETLKGEVVFTGEACVRVLVHRKELQLLGLSKDSNSSILFAVLQKGARESPCGSYRRRDENRTKPEILVYFLSRSRFW